MSLMQNRMVDVVDVAFVCFFPLMFCFFTLACHDLVRDVDAEIL
jgi:hypothetical protein